MPQVFKHLLATIALLVMLLPLAGHAATLVAGASGVDYGPQNGVFDDYINSGTLSVVNNGYTSFRAAFEFDISDIAPGSLLHSATLTVRPEYVEGLRMLEVHGYAGDSMIELADFSRNGLVGNTLAHAGQLTFDVTAMVAAVLGDGLTLVGFNVREEPPPAANLTVMFLAAPTLSIDATSPVPLPPAIVLFSGALAALRGMRRIRL